MSQKLKETRRGLIWWKTKLVSGMELCKERIVLCIVIKQGFI